MLPNPYAKFKVHSICVGVGHTLCSAQYKPQLLLLVQIYQISIMNRLYLFRRTFSIGPRPPPSSPLCHACGYTFPTPTRFVSHIQRSVMTLAPRDVSMTCVGRVRSSLFWICPSLNLRLPLYYLRLIFLNDLDLFYLVRSIACAYPAHSCRYQISGSFHHAAGAMCRVLGPALRPCSSSAPHPSAPCLAKIRSPRPDRRDPFKYLLLNYFLIAPFNHKYIYVCLFICSKNFKFN